MKIIVSLWSFDMFSGNLLNIFTEEYVTLFWIEENFTDGKWSWFLCLVSILCTKELVWKLDRYLATNIFKAKIYKLGTVCVSNFLNLLFKSSYDLVPGWFLLLLFCIKYKLCVVVDMPQTIIPEFISGWKCAK
jgi:hypothetical protein